MDRKAQVLTVCCSLRLPANRDFPIRQGRVMSERDTPSDQFRSPLIVSPFSYDGVTFQAASSQLSL